MRPAGHCMACGTSADQCVANPDGFAFLHPQRGYTVGDHTLIPYDRLHFTSLTDGLPSAPAHGVHHVGWDTHALRGTPEGPRAKRPYDDSDTTRNGGW